MLGPIACLACVTVFIGMAPEPLLAYATAAAAQLADRDAYALAVLGGRP
jgi:multicomponent Na+:H+ antiporter subunit D